MNGGGAMGLKRGAFLPSPLLLLLLLVSACAPRNAALPTPGVADDSEGPESRSALTLSGRTHMFRRALFREQERSARLQQQLDQRSQEIERLQVEVTRLRQHETELRTELDRALTAGATGGTATAPSAPPAPVIGKVAANPEPQPEASAPAVAAAVAEEEPRHREAEAQNAEAIAGLRAALAQEQGRRNQAEAQLARLKKETSTPPYGPHAATQAELVAATQEVSQLRTELENQRAARERLAEDFRALQERAVSDRAATPAASGSSPELRTRLRELEEEKQNITQSFSRSMAESQERAAELERQLTLARTAPAVDTTSAGEVSAARAENQTLRSQLDAEHRRTEGLAAKLKIAMRVTDLIFKMQGQQTQPPPRPQPLGPRR